MSMIERVARALCAKVDGNNPNRMLRTSPVIVYEWEMYKDDAVIAIEEMREPTEAMVEASAAIYGDDWRNRHEYSKDQWRAMVDAALKEQEKA